MSGIDDEQTLSLLNAKAFGLDNSEMSSNDYYAEEEGLRRRHISSSSNNTRATLEELGSQKRISEPATSKWRGAGRRALAAIRRWVLYVFWGILWYWTIEPLSRPCRRCCAPIARRFAERRELIMAMYDQEFAPAAGSLWRRRGTLLRLCGCCWSALSVIGYALTMYVGSEHLSNNARGALYVQHGVSGVNFSLPSLAVTCSEIRSGVLSAQSNDGSPDTSLARLMVAANDALSNEEALPCVCAPMFGKRRRYLAIRSNNASISHHFNPAMITAPWWLDEHREEPAIMIMSERQTRFFPERTESVENTRRRTVRLNYRTADACAGAVAELHKDQAYCVQQCLDLLDGVSVYERAARAARSESV